MSYAYLLQSEADVEPAIPSPLLALVAALTRGIDVLLKVPYFTKQPDDYGSDAGLYHSWCHERYVEAPYTMRSILLLWLRGHYLEAFVLVRHLLESFVQVRYFQRRPEQLRSHWMATTQRDRVSFKVMFEDASPGYYERQYGRLLSGVSHAGFAMSVFSSWVPPEGDSPAKMLPRLGCQFQEQGAAAVMNLTVALLAGFLAWFPLCLSPSAEVVDPDVDNARLRLLEALGPVLKSVFREELGPLIRLLVMPPQPSM